MKDSSSPVYSYLENPSMIDFPGRLAAVLFTTGCNFRCGFCHNGALLKKKDDCFSWNRLSQTLRSFQEQWVDGVVVSGGEPTVSPKLPELVNFLKKYGFAIKLDTNGSHPDVLNALLPQLDYVAMDVKCSLETYPKLTRYGCVERIKESLQLLKDNAVPYEFRTTLITNIHTRDELEKMKPLLQNSSKIVLQPFVPRPDLPAPDMQHYPRTSPEKLKEAARQLQDCASKIVVRGVGIDAENQFSKA